jgi:hypothetical protein
MTAKRRENRRRQLQPDHAGMREKMSLGAQFA